MTKERVVERRGPISRDRAAIGAETTKTGFLWPSRLAA
jgi:hypothetical protein